MKEKKFTDTDEMEIDWPEKEEFHGKRCKFPNEKIGQSIIKDGKTHLGVTWQQLFGFPLVFYIPIDKLKVIKNSRKKKGKT